jgi:hypothetical protein
MSITFEEEVVAPEVDDLQTMERTKRSHDQIPSCWRVLSPGSICSPADGPRVIRHLPANQSPDGSTLSTALSLLSGLAGTTVGRFAPVSHNIRCVESTVKKYSCCAG